MLELPSGCVCCTLQGPLVEALEDLQDYGHVIVEASGVAQPGELVAALGKETWLTLAPLVTVVDTARFSRLHAGLGPFYAEQVAAADIVVANKTDLATPEQLNTALDRIAALNPEAAVIPADHGDIGACVAEKWELPQGLTMAISAHHHCDVPVDPAIHLVSYIRETDASPGVDQLVEVCRDQYNLAPDDVTATVAGAFEEAEEVAALIG